MKPGAEHSRATGIADAFVRITDLQTDTLNGAPLATTIVTHGTTTSPPPGFKSLSNTTVKHDLGRPMRKATQTISFIMLLLSFVRSNAHRLRALSPGDRTIT